MSEKNEPASSKDIWIEVGSLTYVTAVPGGLLFRYEAYAESEFGLGITEAMCFVPMTEKERRTYLIEKTGAENA